MQFVSAAVDFCYGLKDRVSIVGAHSVEFTHTLFTVEALHRAQVRIQLVNDRMDL